MDLLTLFDIDKTLVKAGTAHKEAFSEAFTRVYHVRIPVSAIAHPGMTDQEIVAVLLAERGIRTAVAAQKFPAFMQEAIASFERKILTSRVIALGGVRDLREALRQRNVLLGLATGNLQPIARGRLEKAKLWGYSVGGFGDDDKSRSRLVEIATNRARPLRFPAGCVFLIGDTPLDMAAGAEAAVKTIGVATGKCTISELHAAGTNYACKTFSETKKIVDIICEKA